MKKTTLKKIIKAVRELEIKMSKNNTQFDFYWKKKHKIERKEKRMIEETSNKEALEYYKQNKETLDFCYGFMDKIDNENKAINNQIKQYLTNYVLITLEAELNSLKSKIEKLISDYNQERQKLTINQEKYKYMYVRQD